MRSVNPFLLLYFIGRGPESSFFHVPASAHVPYVPPSHSCAGERFRLDSELRGSLLYREDIPTEDLSVPIVPKIRADPVHYIQGQGRGKTLHYIYRHKDRFRLGRDFVLT